MRSPRLLGDGWVSIMMSEPARSSAVVIGFGVKKLVAAERDLLLEDRSHRLKRPPDSAVALGRQRERKRDPLHPRNRQCDQFGQSSREIAGC